MKTHPQFIKTTLLYPGLLLALASLAVVHPANAALKISLSGAVSDQTHFDADISTTDLLSSAATLSSASQTTNSGLGSVAGTHDGSAASISNDDFINTFPTAITYALNLDAATGGSATGYDISSITSIAGWKDAGFSAQSFTLYVKTVTNESWVQIGTEAFANTANVDSTTGGNGISQSTKTVLTDSTGTIASGVTAIEFIYQTSTYGGSVIREIDVVGTPTVVPEPATWAMLTGGLGVLTLAQRARRRIGR